jgi:hypothetical protein
MATYSTHQICNTCWSKLRPDRRNPHRMTYDGIRFVWDTCCWCGGWNNSGIYVRAPDGLRFCRHQAA